MTRTSPRLARAAVLVGLAALAAPASASAVQFTLTDDAGNFQNLVPGATIRNMSAELGFAFAAEEKRYSVAVIGPNGQSAAPGTDCSSTSSASPERIRYQGNGAYGVVVRTYAAADDFSCAGTPTEATTSFAINAFTTVTAPGTVLLSRQPGSLAAISYPFVLGRNPGADWHDFRYAAGATLAPDGSITGASLGAVADAATGVAGVSFSAPGTYTFVSRATDFGSSGDTGTPWSAPVFVKVLAPFDLTTTTFLDSIGPTYKIAGIVRESSARGKVTVSIARGKKGGKFKRLGSPKIRKGRFVQKFKLTRRGVYRLRYSFKGSPTVAKGYMTERITIRRIF